MKRKTIIGVLIVIFVFTCAPAFGEKLIQTDIISTEKMTIVWGYCPYGMLETSVMKVKKFYITLVKPLMTSD